MPGLNDAKIIIDAGTQAVTEGMDEISARSRAITECVKAGNMDSKRVRQFAGREQAFVKRIRTIKSDLLEAQDKILEAMMEEEG